MYVYIRLRGACERIAALLYVMYLYAMDILYIGAMR